MRITIKRLFHGYATIRDDQAKRAWRDGEDIIIHCGKETMIIPHSDIMGGAINPKKYKSIHDGSSYYLVDYVWRPGIIQEGLGI